MATLSRFVLATLLLSLAACGGPQEPSMISSAQATEAVPALYPPIAGDAVQDGNVYEYH